MAIRRLAIIGDGIIGTALALKPAHAVSRLLDFLVIQGPASIAAGGMLTPAMEADLTALHSLNSLV